MDHRSYAGISPGHRVTIVIAVAATIAAVVLLVLLLSKGSDPSSGTTAAALDELETVICGKRPAAASGRGRASGSAAPA